MAGGGSASGAISGAANGVGSAALFLSPLDVVVSMASSGGVYVADSGNHMIRFVSSSGTVHLHRSTLQYTFLQQQQ